MIIQRLYPILDRVPIISESKLKFATSASYFNKWRIQQGLDSNPNSSGPLRFALDFTYVDGRPIPMGFKKLERMQRQQKLCETIATLSNEIDSTLEDYHKRKQEIADKRKAILSKKLKPKGAALLKKSEKNNS